MVPKLRFPEFEGAGNWRKLRLVCMADKNTRWSFIGGPFGSNLKSSDYVPEGIRVIQLQNIGDAEFVDDYKVFTSEEKADELLSNNIYPGEIILSKMGDPVGRACLIPDTNHRYVMCSDGIRLVVDEKQFSKYFIYVSINSSHFRTLVENTATGSTRKRIGLDDLKNLPMQIPAAPEQQKIAGCLGSLDDLIAAENRKLEALRQHKKGLMQRLFPQPGETVPRLRFAEFRDLPEWDLRTLSSVSDVNPSNEGLPERFIYIDLESVKNSVLTERKEISRDAAPSRAQRLLSHKDIIYQTVRPYQRNNLFFDTNDGCKYVASTGYAQIRAHESPEFLYQLLHTDSFVNSVLARCTGSNYPAINPTALASIEVLLPRKTEQQKIADCLGSLDDLSAAEDQKLEALRQHKQGLMQQIFPSLEDK